MNDTVLEISTKQKYDDYNYIRIYIIKSACTMIVLLCHFMISLSILLTELYENGVNSFHTRITEIYMIRGQYISSQCTYKLI